MYASLLARLGSSYNADKIKGLLLTVASDTGSLLMFVLRSDGKFGAMMNVGLINEVPRISFFTKVTANLIVGLINWLLGPCDVYHRFTEVRIYQAGYSAGFTES